MPITQDRMIRLLKAGETLRANLEELQHQVGSYRTDVRLLNARRLAQEIGGSDREHQVYQILAPVDAIIREMTGRITEERIPNAVVEVLATEREHFRRWEKINKNAAERKANARLAQRDR